MNLMQLSLPIGLQFFPSISNNQHNPGLFKYGKYLGKIIFYLLIYLLYNSYFRIRFRRPY
jgi:hypothetical protein